MDPTSAQNPETQQPQAQGGSSQVPQSPLQQTQQQPAQPPQPQQQVVQPIVVQQPPQPDASSALEDKPKRSKVKVFGFLVIIFFLFSFVVSGVLAYAVAYEKVKLTKYPEVQAAVANSVISLPFMPKTPKFLFIRSILAHQNVTKQSFDVSLALDSSSLADILGVSRFDTEAKGAIDYSNPKDVIFMLDASLTKDFNFELRKSDPILYFKINKLPVALLSIIGFDAKIAEPILEKWVAYDTTPLDTQARRELLDKEVEPLSKEFVQEINERYFDDYILSQMKITQVTYEGKEYYILSLDADSDLINYIGELIEKESNGSGDFSGTDNNKLSDMVKSLSWEIYIAKNTYYTHKLAVTATLEFDQGYYGGALLGTSSDLAENSQANFALVIKFDDFGKEILVETPSDFMTYEDFLQEISVLTRQAFSSGLTGLSDSSDTKRASDLMILRTALELFNADCDRYPSSLDVLIEPQETVKCPNYTGPYLGGVPKDPKGSEYYYQVIEDGTNFDLCAKLDTAIPESDTCPDKNYNYHLTAP